MRTQVVVLCLACLPGWSQLQKPPEGPPVTVGKKAKTRADKESTSTHGQEADDARAVDGQLKAPAEKRATETDASEELKINRKLAAYTGQLAAFTFWLVMVGILQFLMLAAQGVALFHHGTLIKESVGQTENVADATKQTSEALMDGQRGWILVEKVDSPNISLAMSPQFEGTIPFFVYRLRVFGFTPCQIRNAGMRFHLANTKDREVPPEPDLPEEPEYWSNVYGTNITGKAADIPDAGDVLGPRQEMKIGAGLESGGLTRDDMSSINENRRFLCAYGFVNYTDTFGRPHETRFCYIYRISHRTTTLVGTDIETDPSRFRTGGPVEYNKQT